MHWTLNNLAGVNSFVVGSSLIHVVFNCLITLPPYMVLPLFATRFAAYARGIRVSFIQPRFF